MDLTIYTYGHIDSMFYILNGIAMIMSKPFTDLMVKTIAIVATCYYGLKAVYASSQGNSRQHLIKIAGMVLVINGLLVPKTSMSIIDNVTKEREEKIDNLPYGFAVPVGALETFGQAITATFEQGFSTTKSANYGEYGMVFGARLVRESRNWRIKNPEFVYNMNSFIRGCVVRGVARGKYSLDEIFQNNNIWDTVSRNASKLREIEIRRGQDHLLMTCHDAVEQVLKPAFQTELDVLVRKYSKKDFGLAGNPTDVLKPRGTETGRTLFKDNISTVFGEYLKTNVSGEESLKQYMMLNSLGDYKRTYGFGRASMQQENTWRVAGDMAEENLPMLLSVMKGMVYASFIFMVPLMLLGGGVGKYLKYLTIVASLQLWPALNAVLNMFIELYSAGTMHELAAGAISFTNYSRVGDYSDKIVAIAAGLQMTVPFLAFALMQGGVSGFIHLANNITGASSNAANMAASEVTSNNRSMDNLSYGNTQMAMQQGFKTDMNTSYKRGMHERQLGNGGLEKVTAKGETFYVEGAGTTAGTGDVNMNLASARNAHMSKGFNDEKRTLESKQASFHDSERFTQNQAASWITDMAKRDMSNKNFDFSKYGEQGKAVQKAISNAKTLHDKYNYSWDQIAEGSLKADLKVPLSPLAGGVAKKLMDKTGMGGLGKLAPEVNVSADARLAALNTSNQATGDDDSLSVDNMTREDWNNVIKAGMSEDFVQATSSDKSFSKNISDAYSKERTAEESMMTQAEKVKSYSEAMSMAQSADASMSKNMRHEVAMGLMNNYGVSSREAQDMIENGDSRVARLWGSMVEKDVNSLVNNQIQARQMSMTDDAQANVVSNAHSAYSSNVSKDPNSRIEKMAASNGIDPSNASFVDDSAKQKAEAMMQENSQKYQEVQSQNQAIQDAKQANVNKLEDGRIGQGPIGSTLGVGGPKNPSTIKKGNDEKASNSNN